VIRAGEALGFVKSSRALWQSETQYIVEHGSVDFVFTTAGTIDHHAVEVARCLVLRNRAARTTLHEQSASC